MGLSVSDLQKLRLVGMLSAQNNPLIKAGRVAKEVSEEGASEKTKSSASFSSEINSKSVDLTQNGVQDGGSMVSTGPGGAMGLGGSHLNVLG